MNGELFGRSVLLLSERDESFVGDAVDVFCIQLERLIPYGHEHLLQGNIHILAPGATTDGTIQHSGEEVGYVLEGRIELTVGGETHVVEAGDSFHYRSEMPHGYRNLGPGPARVLFINTPPTF